MQNDFEYYLMKRKNDQAYPLIKIVDYNPGLMQLEFNKPIPRNPIMADFLSGPEDIISKRVAEAMKDLNMEGVKFIPSRLKYPEGKVTDNYVCVIVDQNTYTAMDKDKSIYTYENESYTVSKIVLDKAALKNIPLSRRLGFRLEETPSYHLYHKSIVDAIMMLNPTGIYFQNIEDCYF